VTHDATTHKDKYIEVYTHR